jgi:hypothetical protein
MGKCKVVETMKIARFLKSVAIDGTDVNVKYVHKVSLITGLCYSKA